MYINTHNNINFVSPVHIYATKSYDSSIGASTFMLLKFLILFFLTIYPTFSLPIIRKVIPASYRKLPLSLSVTCIYHLRANCSYSSSSLLSNTSCKLHHFIPEIAQLF